MVMTGEQIQYAVIAIVFIAMVIIVVRNFKKSKKRNAGCSSCPYSCGCLKYNELNNKNKIKNGKPKKT